MKELWSLKNGYNFHGIQWFWFAACYMYAFMHVPVSIRRSSAAAPVCMIWVAIDSFWNQECHWGYHIQRNPRWRTLHIKSQLDTVADTFFSLVKPKKHHRLSWLSKKCIRFDIRDYHYYSVDMQYLAKKSKWEVSMHVYMYVCLSWMKGDGGKRHTLHGTRRAWSEFHLFTPCCSIKTDTVRRDSCSLP